MMVWRTSPTPKRSPAPLARLCTAAASADRCSASSRLKSLDATTTSPSRERITAFLKSSTRSARSSSSQARSRPAPAPCAFITPPRPAAPRCLVGSLPVYRSFVAHLVGLSGGRAATRSAGTLPDHVPVLVRGRWPAPLRIRPLPILAGPAGWPADVGTGSPGGCGGEDRGKCPRPVDWPGRYPPAAQPVPVPAPDAPP